MRGVLEADTEGDFRDRLAHAAVIVQHVLRPLQAALPDICGDWQPKILDEDFVQTPPTQSDSRCQELCADRTFPEVLLDFRKSRLLPVVVAARRCCMIIGQQSCESEQRMTQPLTLGSR